MKEESRCTAPGADHEGGWQRTRYDALLLLTVLIWGFNFPVAKSALRLIEPHVFNALRFSVSTGVIGTVEMLRARRARKREATFRENWRRVVVLALVGHVIYQIAFIEGLQRTSAGSAALLIASTPLWTALLGLAFRSDMLSPAAWLGLLTAFAGTVVVIGSGSNAGFSSVETAGNLLITAAAISWATSTVLSQSLLRLMPAARLTWLGMALSLPVLWLIAVPRLEGIDLRHISLPVWGAILYSGGLSTGLAYLLWNLGVKHIGPSHSAAYSNLVPLIGILGGIVFLGEGFTAAESVGAACVVGGLIVVRRTRLAKSSVRAKDSG